MSPKHGNLAESKMKPMKYTSDGVPKNWDGKDWITYKWAMLTVFEDNDLKDIAVGTITRAMLQAATAEKQEEFKHKQIKTKRMVGTSVPPEIRQQISDKETVSEMWTELCDLFEGKQSEATRAYTIRRLVTELWQMKLMPGEDANLHLCKMFRIRVYTPSKRDRGEHKHEGGRGDQGKFGHQGKSKEKSRACYICGSEDHIKVNCPEKTKKQNGAENSDSKRKPRSNCTIRRDNDVQHELSDEDPGVATGMMTHGLTGVEVNEQPVNGLIAEVAEGAEITGFGATRDQVSQGRVDDGTIDAMTTERVAGQDREAAADNTSCWWYFDTASNSHVIGNRSYFVSFTEDSTDMQSVHGVTPNLASRIAVVLRNRKIAGVLLHTAPELPTNGGGTPIFREVT
ncbi:Multidrug resistance protein ABC Superfamily, partial [Phytophthora palmivora]